MTILESGSVTCPPVGEMASPSVLSFTDTDHISLTITVLIITIGGGNNIFTFSKKSFLSRNLELSFLTADHYLGIPPLLDVDEMLLYDYPDQFSIMTYVAQFHQVFFRPFSG